MQGLYTSWARPAPGNHPPLNWSIVHGRQGHTRSLNKPLPGTTEITSVRFAGLFGAKPKVGIVATLGPKTDSPETIKQLIEAGVTIFRLNFSHGSHEEHGKRIEWIRNASAEMVQAGKLEKPVQILADLQGPKIRVGDFSDGSVKLEKGQQISLVNQAQSAEPSLIPVPIPEVVTALQPGHRILLDDGKLELKVDQDLQDGKVACTVVRGGVLKNDKGMNLPNVKLSLPALSDKDKTDLAYALSKGVDYVAVSFVRSAEDVNLARQAIKSLGKDVPIISKIEKPEAVELKTLKAIIAASDGAMVARGDLGIEADIVELPRLQELIIKETKAKKKPVIVATQMLESMMNSTIPSRADVSDIADAVKDGTDYVMLSGETAVGEYPVETVKMMNRIVKTYSREQKSRFWGDTEFKNAIVENVKKLIVGVLQLVADEVKRAASRKFSSVTSGGAK